MPHWASFGSCCQGNLSKFFSDISLNCLSKSGFNLVSGKGTKIENKPDNKVVLIAGREKKNYRIKHLLEYNIFHLDQIKAFQSLSIFPPMEEPITSDKWKRE